MMLILSILALVGAFRLGRRPAPANVDHAHDKATLS
jgi:hypothetical protein